MNTGYYTCIYASENCGRDISSVNGETKALQETQARPGAGNAILRPSTGTVSRTKGI